MARLTPQETLEEARLAQARGDWTGFFACFDRDDLLGFLKNSLTALMRDPSTMQEVCRKGSVPSEAAKTILEWAGTLSEVAQDNAQDKRSGVTPREAVLHAIRQADHLLLAALKSVPDLAGLTADAERAMRQVWGGGSVSSSLFGGETLVDVVVAGSKAWGVRIRDGHRTEVGFVRKRRQWYIRLMGRRPPGPRKPIVSAAPLTQSLERIGRWLRENARPSFDAMRPGLAASVVRARLEPLASPVSHELLELYQWRDGQEPHGLWEFIPGLRFLPLEEAIGERELLQRAERELAAMMPAQPRHNWLPILYFEGNGSMAELGGDALLTAIVDHDMEDPGLRPTYSSVASYMEEIAERFESGAYFVTGDTLGEDRAAVKAIHLKYYPGQP